MPSDFPDDRDQEISATDLIHRYWRMGELSWKLDTLQESITHTVRRQSSAKKICILSSRQIGKSFWAVNFALEWLIRNPGKIARIIAPTLTACHDIVNDNLSRIIADAPRGFITRRSNPSLRWEIATPKTVSSLRIGALERQHVDSNRGGNAGLVIFEEPGFVKGEDFTYGVDSVIGPQLLRSKGTQVFVTTPSEDPEHPVHTRIKPETEALGTFFSYSVYDSPSVTPEMIAEAIKLCGGIDTDAFQREYMARIIRPASSLVVPRYNEAVHVVAYEAPTVAHWSITIDWGGVKDLTVALMHTYDFINGIDLIWDERVFPPNTSSDAVGKELKGWESRWGFNIHQRNADVFSQTMIDLHAMQYPVQLPIKGQWLASVNSMAVKFSTNRVMIHPRCEFLRKTLRGGMFNRNRTDFDRTPELGHMDALAALMYGFNSQSRSNPYDSGYEMGQQVFVLKQPQSAEQLVAEQMGGKVFGGGPKAFGAFRRNA